MKAEEICTTAANLVSGDRAKTHGDKEVGFKLVANLWGAYLGVPLASHQAAQMMVLLKIARTCVGQTNIEDYIDQAGYAGIAGELIKERKHDD